MTSLEEARPLIRDVFQDWKTRFEKRDFKDLIDGALVKIKFNDFQRTTRERKIHEMPSYEDFESLFAEAWKRSPKPVRLLGLGVRLASPADRVPQLSLFGADVQKTS